MRRVWRSLLLLFVLHNSKQNALPKLGNLFRQHFYSSTAAVRSKAPEIYPNPQIPKNVPQTPIFLGGKWGLGVWGVISGEGVPLQTSWIPQTSFKHTLYPLHHRGPPDEWTSVGYGAYPSTKLCMYLTGTRGGEGGVQNFWRGSLKAFGSKFVSGTEGSPCLRDLSPSHGHYWGVQVTFKHFLHVLSFIHTYLVSV